MSETLIISNANELYRIYNANILYICAEGNYSIIVLANGDKTVVSQNLLHCQKMIEKQLKSNASHFIRIGKSLIINKLYIFKINIGRQELVLSNTDMSFSATLSASKEALKQLKRLVETSL